MLTPSTKKCRKYFLLFKENDVLFILFGINIEIYIGNFILEFHILLFLFNS